jgi:hypothetical protein
MSMKWIRDSYHVPAKRGARIEYTGDGKPKIGTITSARSGRLNVRFDGEDFTSFILHPTWKIRYLPVQKVQP